MKFQFSIFFSYLFMVYSLGLSQNEQVFSGKVIDNETGESIKHATLIWINSDQNFSTDAIGNFRIKRTENTSSQLKFSAIGYKSKTIFMLHNQAKVEIRLEPIIYQMPEQDILIGEQVLKKAFSNTSHLLEKPFTLEMTLTGSWYGMRETDSYNIQALVEFHYYKNSQIWLGMLKEKRNLSEPLMQDVNYGYWLDNGLTTLDRQIPPCKLKKQKCWDEKLEIEYVKTSQYDGKKVYIISLKIDGSTKNFTETSPFGVDQYETEFVIDASSFHILRQVSQMFPKDGWKSRFRDSVWVDGQKFTSIRNYRTYNGKYYLASLKTIAAFKSHFGSKPSNHRVSYLEHELVTTRILSGQKYSKPNFSESYYPLFEFDQVPFNEDYWENYDKPK